MLALQLKEGQPILLVEGGLEPIKLQVTTVVNNGEWHTFHLRLDYQVNIYYYIIIPYSHTL